MEEIRCPKCGEVFLVDESGYAQIVQQVRDREFDKELKRREADLVEKKDRQLEITKIQQKGEYDKIISDKALELSNKDREIEKIKS